jgi:hypothetical protein
MSKMTAFFPLEVGHNSTTSSALVPLVTNVDDNFDDILDEALAEYHTQLNARVDDMHRELAVDTKPVRERLWDFKDSQVRLGSAKGIILGNVYIKFEEYLREGNGDNKGGFSELKAGSFIHWHHDILLPSNYKSKAYLWVGCDMRIFANERTIRHLCTSTYT